MGETTDPGPDGSDRQDHDHDHDHGVSYGPELDEDAARAAADPRALRRWQLAVAVGAALLAIGWVLWPALHVLLTERALRNIGGSYWTLGFAVQVALASWLLTVRPPWAAYPAHAVGTWMIRGLATIGAALAVLETFVANHPVASGLIGWLEYPVVIFWIGLGFAYLGRLLRLELDGRFANLADLGGVALVLLWIASQLVSGYPSMLLLVPSGVAMVLAELVLIVLVLRYVRAG